MDIACIYLTQKILLKCNLQSRVTVQNIDDIDVSLINLLFNKICMPFLDDPPFLPPINQESENLRAILDCISCDFLNYDLSARISAQAIISQNIDAIHFLLEIFDNLCDCLFDSSSEEVQTNQKRKRKQQNRVVPLHLRAKLTGCGKKSALYSPRTRFFRRPPPVDPSQSNVATGASTNVPELFQPSDLLLLKKFGFSQDDIKLLQLENLVHRAKFQSLLNRLRREHEKNENDIKRRTAKIILTKSIRRKINYITDRKTELICYKKAKLVVENSLKDRKRFRASASRPVSDLENSTICENFVAIKRFEEADEEAKKFFSNFLQRQTESEQNAADSLENFANDKITQLK